VIYEKSATQEEPKIKAEHSFLTSN
jgi:hypothetical protein